MIQPQQQIGAAAGEQSHSQLVAELRAQGRQQPHSPDTAER